MKYVIEATTASGLPVAAHLSLIPKMNQSLESAGGENITLNNSSIEWSAQQVGGEVTHAGYRLHLPKSATLHWPALPHNPYRKGGRSELSEGRIEIRIPFDEQHKTHTIIIEVLK